MIANIELKKEVVMLYFTVPCWNLPEGTEDITKNLSSRDIDI
jgi:hypothetical protein